jgi:hypothetical protein
VVRRVVDAEDEPLAERPPREVLCKRCVRRAVLLRDVVREQARASDERGARAPARLEARRGGQLRAGPQALAAAVGGLDDCVRAAVALSVARERLGRRAEERDEIRVCAQRVRRTSKPDRAVERGWRERGVPPRADRDEPGGLGSVREVAEQRRARRREDEPELGRERRERGLLRAEREEDVCAAAEEVDKRLRGDVLRERWCL